MSMPTHILPMAPIDVIIVPEFDYFFTVLMLRRLQKVVKKVRLLLSFNMEKWLLRSTSDLHRLSFEGNNVGLLNIVDDGSDIYYDAPSPALSRTISATWSAIHRTVSGPLLPPPPPLLSSSSSSSLIKGDVDQRAEAFIANFHKRLQMERQISLELRYASSPRRTSSE